MRMFKWFWNKLDENIILHKTWCYRHFTDILLPQIECLGKGFFSKFVKTDGNTDLFTIEFS